MSWIHGSQEVHVALDVDEIYALTQALAKMKHEGRITITIHNQEDENPIASFRIEEYVEQDKFKTVYKS